MKENLVEEDEEFSQKDLDEGNEESSDENSQDENSSSDSEGTSSSSKPAIKYGFRNFSRITHAGDSFEIVFWISNTFQTPYDFSVYSYAYKSSVCISDSGAREHNIKVLTIPAGQNKTFVFENKINEGVSPGNYSFKVVMQRLDLKTPYEIRSVLEVREKTAETVESGVSETTEKNSSLEIKTEEKSNESKTSLNKSISSLFSEDLNSSEETAYKSKNEKIKDYFLYSFAGVVLLGSLFFVWKKKL